MKSPFPGMDPYLEAHWLDVHTAFVAEARRVLNRLLPQGLVARAEERVAVESDDEVSKRIGPDVRVFSPASSDPSHGRGGILIEAPYKLVVELEPIIERFIRIFDAGGELITVIEFLSPTNKRGPGMVSYREKRADLLAAGVHVVEIDLMRAGDWRALMLPERCPRDAFATYRAIVPTSLKRPAGYLFPIRLQEPMPNIPVPLRPTDVPTPLPLQTMLESVYEDGRYGQTIDYRIPLDPPLSEDEAVIAETILKSLRS